MKKVIATLLIVSGLCFTQTGMVSDGGMGVWFNSHVMNIDSDWNDDWDPNYSISFDYMMDMGLEIGLDYHMDALIGQVYGFDYNPLDLGFTYHMKGEGMSWAFGATMHDFTDVEDCSCDHNAVNVGGYTDSNMWFTYTHDLDLDDFDQISFGKLWAMDSMTIGAGYYAFTEEMGKGWLTMSVGTTF